MRSILWYFREWMMLICQEFAPWPKGQAMADTASARRRVRCGGWFLLRFFRVMERRDSPECLVPPEDCNPDFSSPDYSQISHLHTSSLLLASETQHNKTRLRYSPWMHVCDDVLMFEAGRIQMVVWKPVRVISSRHATSECPRKAIKRIRTSPPRSGIWVLQQTRKQNESGQGTKTATLFENKNFGQTNNISQTELPSRNELRI